MRKERNGKYYLGNYIVNAEVGNKKRNESIYYSKSMDHPDHLVSVWRKGNI